MGLSLGVSHEHLWASHTNTLGAHNQLPARERIVDMLAITSIPQDSVSFVDAFSGRRGGDFKELDSMQISEELCET